MSRFASSDVANRHNHCLIEFDNKMVILTQWGWNYFTRQRGARLITEFEGVPSPTSTTETFAKGDRISVTYR